MGYTNSDDVPELITGAVVKQPFLVVFQFEKQEEFYYDKNRYYIRFSGCRKNNIN